MPEDFKAALRRMIDEEPARKAALQSTVELQHQEIVNQQKAAAALQLAIAERIGQVSSLLREMAEDVNVTSQNLGFSANVSTSGQPGQSVLMLNLHGPEVVLLRITVNRVGDVFFEPGLAPTFNLLRSNDSPIMEAVTRFVQKTYRALSEHRPA